MLTSSSLSLTESLKTTKSNHVMNGFIRRWNPSPSKSFLTTSDLSAFSTHVRTPILIYKLRPTLRCIRRRQTSSRVQTKQGQRSALLPHYWTDRIPTRAATKPYEGMRPTLYSFESLPLSSNTIPPRVSYAHHRLGLFRSRNHQSVPKTLA